MTNVTDLNLILIEDKYRSKKFSLIELIHDFFEYIIFCRFSWFGYKSNPRVNLRFVSCVITSLWGVAAAITVSSILSNYLYPSENNQSIGQNIMASIEPLEGRPQNNTINKLNTSPIVINHLTTLILSFLGFSSLLFWREKTSHYDKWKYLATLYNSYVTTPVTSDPSLQNNREILISSLALDLIDLDMWAHYSFRTFFKNILIKSMNKFNENPSNKPIYFDGTGTEINLSKTQARKVLQYYQHSCLPKTDFPEDKDLKRLFLAS